MAMRRVGRKGADVRKSSQRKLGRPKGIPKHPSYKGGLRRTTGDKGGGRRTVGDTGTEGRGRQETTPSTHLPLGSRVEVTESKPARKWKGHIIQASEDGYGDVLYLVDSEDMYRRPQFLWVYAKPDDHAVRGASIRPIREYRRAGQ